MKQREKSKFRRRQTLAGIPVSRYPGIPKAATRITGSRDTGIPEKLAAAKNYQDFLPVVYSTIQL